MWDGRTSRQLGARRVLQQADISRTLTGLCERQNKELAAEKGSRAAETAHGPIVTDRHWGSQVSAAMTEEREFG